VFRKIMGGVGLFIIVFLVMGSIGDSILHNDRTNNLSQLSDSNYSGIESESDAFIERESPTEVFVNNNFRDIPFEYMYPVDPKIRPPLASIKSSAPTSKKSVITTGIIKIAVLLVCFTDVSFDSANGRLSSAIPNQSRSNILYAGYIDLLPCVVVT